MSVSTLFFAVLLVAVALVIASIVGFRLFRRKHLSPVNDASTGEATKKTEAPGETSQKELEAIDKKIETLIGLSEEFLNAAGRIETAEANLQQSFLQLLELQRTLVSTSQRLMQSINDSIQSIDFGLNSLIDVMGQDRQLVGSGRAVDRGEPTNEPLDAIHFVPPAGEEAVDALEGFVSRNRNQINQACFKGIEAVNTLLSEIDPDRSIGFESPSEKGFILTKRRNGKELIGKAYFLPGQYLSRPWIDWFNIPKGIYERVEQTAEPATLAQDPNGAWRVVRKGTVVQH